jgi:serine/threonine-protein kinase
VSPLLSTGDRVSDTLVIDRLLGEGAFAEVHRVKHEFLGWQAMKLFKRVASLAETRRMLEEARLLSTLGHPNIVRLFDAGTVPTPEGVRGFFTMEYVAGGSLEVLHNAHGRTVPVDLVADVIEQMANGLAIAHSQTPPILHRDITLANVLVGYDESGLRIRLSDFGLAKRADPFTLLASAQGTYAFMAPEVLRNQGYSCAGDVFSVGTIAYLLLTNRLPYDPRGGSITTYSAARYNQPPLAPSRYNPDVDDPLDNIILNTLEANPATRTPHAGALAEALQTRRLTSTPSGSQTEPAAESPTVEAKQLVEEALRLGMVVGRLEEAADLMEEAVGLSPQLRELYLDKLTMWRRGVTM